MRATQLPAIVLAACLSAACAAAPASVTVPDFNEINAHFIGPMPAVRTPWVDLTAQNGPGGWNFRITVDSQGRVTQAKPVWGPAARRELAAQAVKALRFKPFEREGRAVRVQFEQGVQSVVEDYVGPADRHFPSSVDLAQVRIAMRRTACYGSCPDYWVEVRGDGRVTYRGYDHVLVKGERHWKLAPEAVAELMERLRRADYFQLGGHYVTDVTDFPTYVTRVSFGRQKKFVLDYAGNLEPPPGLTPTDPTPPRMPEAVTEVENAIDALSGVLSWVRGDEHTMARLREAHWNFRSAAAGSALLQLVSNCQTDLAMNFIRAGAPIRVAAKGRAPGLAVVDAARCGSMPLVRLLESRGALARQQDAQAFLESAVRGGYPELVALALLHGADVKRKGTDAEPLTVIAAQAMSRREDEKGDLGFDPAQVVRQLIGAGADANARNGQGSTALHDVHSADVARALIEGGADPNARNVDGETPLFNGYFEEVKPVLIAAGADISARDRYGRTPLFAQLYPASAQALIDAGADLDARDLEGSTAVESTTREEVAWLLLQAGAALPNDPKRLAAFIDRATEWKWELVLPVLQRAAEKAKAP